METPQESSESQDSPAPAPATTATVQVPLDPWDTEKWLQLLKDATSDVSQHRALLEKLVKQFPTSVRSSVFEIEASRNSMKARV